MRKHCQKFGLNNKLLGFKKERKKTSNGLIEETMNPNNYACSTNQIVNYSVFILTDKMVRTGFDFEQICF